VTAHGRWLIDAPTRAACCRGIENRTAGGAQVVDELDDGDGDGAEQEDVDETLLAEDELAGEPRREERGRDEPDHHVTSPPRAPLSV